MRKSCRIAERKVEAALMRSEGITRSDIGITKKRLQATPKERATARCNTCNGRPLAGDPLFKMYEWDHDERDRRVLVKSFFCACVYDPEFGLEEAESGRGMEILYDLEAPTQ